MIGLSINQGLGVGISGASSRALLNSALSGAGVVANYQPGKITGTTNASAWLNSIGAAPSLAQASGAAQPIILPFSGTKYAWLPSVSGNYVSTPHKAGSTLTGDMSVVFTISMNSVTPATSYIGGQWPTSGNYNWVMAMGSANGLPTFIYTTNGTTTVTKTSSATLASAGISASQQFYLGIYHQVDNGASGNNVIFYTSTDKINWVQLGTTQTTAGAVTRFNSNGALELGSVAGGTAMGPAGKYYSEELYSGNYFAGTGTLVANFNAAAWTETTTNGATAVSSTTGETWKLNNTGTLLAQIVGSPQLLFDGAADYMQAATTLIQPTTVIMVGKQITWTSLHALFDGDGLATGELVQTTSSPTLDISSGTPVAPNTGLVLNTYGIVTATFNGASSALQVNANAPTTGNAGTGNMGGFTLGANASGLLFGNLQAKEVIILNAVPSAAKLANILALLNSIHGGIY